MKTIWHRLGLAACVWSFVAATCVAQQVPSNAAEAFKTFSSNFDRFMPPFMREMTPEQIKALENVEIPFSEEAKYGRAVMQAYEAHLRNQNLRLVRRGKDVAYLKKLVKDSQPLMTNARRYREIRVAIIPLDVADAFSVPGGDLLFSQGLLETAGNEAALMGVVCHELAHLDRGHQLLELRRAKLNGGTRNSLNSPSDFLSMLKPFHPEFERQADEYAVRWMAGLGYAPQELAHLLSRWDNQQNANRPWQDALPGFIRSHPDAGQRAAAVLRMAAAHPKAEYIGIENLQKRIPMSEMRF